MPRINQRSNCHRQTLAILLNPVTAFFSCSSVCPHLRYAIRSRISGVIPHMSWDNVYRLVQRIPRGKVLTYGGLARALRLPGGARTAGRAMAGTPSGKGIPWHRVIGDRGQILIRGPHALLQKKLLESEGVSVVEFRVDLKRHLWQLLKTRKGKGADLRTKRRK
jgi:methylated-DNA-protein-cysteine methyltransferase related protein